MTLERFDRLIAIRGDTVKGLPVTAWATNLDSYDRDLLLRAAIECTRTLILPEWTLKRPDDRRPHDALAATEAWIAQKSEDHREVAKAAAKACTEAKNEFYGHDHRIAEAARACAWASSAKDLTDKSDIWDALVAVEQELLDRIALVSEYQRLPEVRRSIVATLRRVLEPEPEKATAPVASGPVPYSASGTFVVGQRLTHVKFGDLEVVTVNGSAIEVKLADGTIKKLAHKPK
ncbi:MAG: hypothetical protein NT062_30850 [Proteobacteria bacterium]|nr:hypothetical protein [Pseudomonadota bacterium]